MEDPSNNENIPLQPSNDNIHNFFNIFVTERLLPIQEAEDVEMIDVDERTPILPVLNINDVYPSWSRRYRYLPLINSVNNIIPSNAVIRAGGILNRSFDEDKPKYKHVLSAAGKEQVKIVKYNPETFKEQTMCPIMQESFTKDEDISLLPCNHIFKTEAIMNWLEKEKACCPLCRHKLESKEIEKEAEPRAASSSGFTIRNLLQYIEQREEEREEADIQHAIMESLRDISNNNQ